ncbi:MAG: EAL domain-containing protein [Planctomycetes bacterium]|nr:EAL domain-containing protein [Planctomycetota bacterium]
MTDPHELDPTGSAFSGRLAPQAEWLRQIAEHVRDVFWLTEPDSLHIHYISPAFESIWGRTPESLYENPGAFMDAVHPDDRTHVISNRNRKARVGFDVEYRIVRPDGEIRWIRDRAFPILNDAGEVVRIAGIAQNVTRRKRAEDKLQKRESWWRSLFEHTNDLVTVTDTHGRRLYHSPSVERVLGYGPNELEGDSALEIVHPDDQEALRGVLAKLILKPEQPLRTRYRLRRVDGRYVYMESTVVYLPGLIDGGAIVSCATNVTDRTLRDPATGLVSQTFLEHHLELRRERSENELYPLSILLADLDQYSSIVSSLGELEGERILRVVAERFEEALAEMDLVAKLDAERFAFVLQGVNEEEQAEVVIERLRHVLQQPIATSAGEISLSASFGLVVAPPLGSSVREVLRKAESALERSQHKGPGGHKVFNFETGNYMLERMATETALRKAVHEGDIIAHFQPIVDLSTGRVAGFEALARWQRSQGALVMPEVFIPIAEQSRLICDIDMAVLRNACVRLTEWRKKFPEYGQLQVAVNLSTRNFTGGNVIEDIDEVLHQTGTPPAAVKLEITESSLIEKPDEMAAIMHLLAQRGLQFELDDFGTGYSSLSYLHRFPFQTLKVDRDFVASLGTPGERPALVNAIVAMARSMGLETVAEGVDTTEQLEFVREAGCHFAQGYGIAMPMSADDAEALLEADKRY